MNNNLIETELLLSKLKNSNLAPNVEVMVSPSNLFLKTSIDFLYGSKIEVVSQNVPVSYTHLTLPTKRIV